VSTSHENHQMEHKMEWVYVDFNFIPMVEKSIS
jgi:hypothetical protein